MNTRVDFKRVSLTLVGVSCLLTASLVSAESVWILDEDSAVASGPPCGQSDFFPQNYGRFYATCQRNGSVLNTGPVLRLRTPGALDSSGGGSSSTSGTVWRAYARWASGFNRCSNVRVEVRRNNGASLVLTRTYDFIPDVNSHNWIPMGTFTAVPGQNYEITYYANNAIGGAGTGIGCFTTPDGAMFVKETFDGTDISNLESTDVIDEAGLEFANAGTKTVQTAPAVNTCGLYTVLTQMSVAVPASPTTSYVQCIATGETDLDSDDGRIVVGIDDAGGTAVPDRSRNLEVNTDEFTSGNWESFKQWAVQNVYSVSASNFTTFRNFYLKACREATNTNGVIVWDPFVCTVLPTRR